MCGFPFELLAAAPVATSVGAIYLVVWLREGNNVALVLGVAARRVPQASPSTIDQPAVLILLDSAERHQPVV